MMLKEKRDRILNIAESYRDYTASILSRLVRIPSLSGREEAMMSELKRLFSDAGIKNIHTDGLGNLIGKTGHGEKILAFDGHMDTVDTGIADNWIFDPFSGRIDNGFVLGRGSVDQKGGLASMITAARILDETGIPDYLTVYFIGSVMEEDCDGLCWKYIIEKDRIRPHAVILTEPTNLTIARGQRGRMEIEIEFTGISSHGSAPEHGKNAIYLASDAALKIRDLNGSLGNHDFLGKGSIAVTRIKSDSPALCAIPDYASIYIDRRLTLGETRESAIAELENVFQDPRVKITVPYYQGLSYTGMSYGMEKYYPTWIMPEDHKAIQMGTDVYNELFNSEPVVGKWLFSTNAISIKGIYDIPVLGFGPGEESLAHAPNEKVSIDQLVKASAFYAAFALGFQL
ncbi:MAG: YgeY family selenium metabolism-linked hydrolase [Bacteroidales bacterium]|nr:MAG: YgeY family selenium metabolism-linked hydrolase [Bacteroidales bacterium]